MCVCSPLVSGLDFVRVLCTNHTVSVERLLSRVDLVLQILLQTNQLADLTVDLVHFLDHHFLHQLLTKHGDRHDRSRTLATLVRGDLVRSVVALVAHAIIIQRQAIASTPSEAKS